MRFYIVEQTAHGLRALPYTETGFANRSAARRHLACTSGDSWCHIYKGQSSSHALDRARRALGLPLPW